MPLDPFGLPRELHIFPLAEKALPDAVGMPEGGRLLVVSVHACFFRDDLNTASRQFASGADDLLVDHLAVRRQAKGIDGIGFRLVGVMMRAQEQLRPYDPGDVHIGGHGIGFAGGVIQIGQRTLPTPLEPL